MKYGLRKMKEDDLELVLQWRNSHKVRENMINNEIIRMSDHISWFQKVLKSDEDFYFIFVMDNSPSGLVYFNHVDQINKDCFWGFYLGKDNFPKGTGSMMGILGLDYAFNDLGMKKVYGEVLDFNKISRNFHIKMGFKELDKIDKNIERDKKNVHLIRYVIHKHIWKQNRKLIKI